jgi:hypothetical protein
MLQNEGNLQNVTERFQAVTCGVHSLICRGALALDVNCNTSVCRQYSFFRPDRQLIHSSTSRGDAELRMRHEGRMFYPPLPPLRWLRSNEEQVCAAIACDIDHTLINQGILRPLTLPPSSRVSRHCPLSFRPFGGAEAEALLG